MPMQPQPGQPPGGLMEFLQMLAQQYQGQGAGPQGMASMPMQGGAPPMQAGMGGPGGPGPMAAQPRPQPQMTGPPPQGETGPYKLGPHLANEGGGQQDPALKARLLETLMRIKQQQQMGGPGIGQQRAIPTTNMHTP